jgi:tungstate transport system substrate-binding protein
VTRRNIATLWTLTLLLAGGCTRSAATVTLATTTSVANSGLLDQILPAYQFAVRPIQAGSGRALDMLASGQADVVISHAPAREAEYLRMHPSAFYRKVLYNDFLIVGPATDPAHITGLADAVTAMQRIAQSGARFLSRGDESGTHDRERQLWTAAGVNALSPHIVVAGAGMGQTLRIASETDAYTITDRGTFEALRGSVRLRELLSGDQRLLNTYAVIAEPSNDQGIRFARWLAEGDGRGTLEKMLLSRQVTGFTLWPDRVPANSPDATVPPSHGANGSDAPRIR